MRKSTSVQNPGPATAESSEGPPSSTGVPHRHRAAVIVKIGTAAAGDPRHWQPGTFSRRRRSCDSLHNTGDSGSTGKHGQALLSIQAARASSGKAAASAMGVWVPPSAGQELPPRCSGTVLLYRPGFAGIRPLCKLQMKPKLFSAPLPAGTGCDKMAVDRLFYP